VSDVGRAITTLGDGPRKGARHRNAEGLGARQLPHHVVEERLLLVELDELDLGANDRCILQRALAAEQDFELDLHVVDRADAVLRRDHIERRSGVEIGGIEIVLPGNADQRE
jgi:hypothetical protein